MIEILVWLEIANITGNSRFPKKDVFANNEMSSQITNPEAG
jgi:hypothetical protein